MKKLVVALTAIAAFTGSALAADMAPRTYAKAAPVAVAAVNWTGCYVGGGGGTGMWNQETVGRDALGVAFTREATGGGRGWYGTVGAGCDYQFAGPLGNWVIGAFADGSWGSIKGKPHFTVDLTADDEKLSSNWAAGGRIGYLVVPQLLTYFSAGYTESRFDQFNLLNEFIPNGPTGLYVGAHTYKGWFLGSGFEHSLSFLPGLFWKTEYRYSEFQSDRIPQLCASAVLCNVVGQTGTFYDSKKYSQTVTTQLVYRFNWGGGPVVAKY